MKQKDKKFLKDWIEIVLSGFGAAALGLAIWLPIADLYRESANPIDILMVILFGLGSLYIAFKIAEKVS